MAERTPCSTSVGCDPLSARVMSTLSRRPRRASSTLRLTARSSAGPRAMRRPPGLWPSESPTTPALRAQHVERRLEQAADELVRLVERLDRAGDVVEHAQAARGGVSAPRGRLGRRVGGLDHHLVDE
jgi:hypothetical protein